MQVDEGGWAPPKIIGGVAATPSPPSPEAARHYEAARRHVQEAKACK